MTCKNCYKNDVCYYRINAEQANCEGVTIINCSNFKDKRSVLEIPCDIGTEVFLSDNINQHHRVKEYHLIDKRLVMSIHNFEFDRVIKRFVDETFNKTVFLDKNSAIKASENNSKQAKYVLSNQILKVSGYLYYSNDKYERINYYSYYNSTGNYESIPEELINGARLYKKDNKFYIANEKKAFWIPFHSIEWEEIELPESIQLN